MGFAAMSSSDDGSETDPEALRAARVRWSPPENEVPAQAGGPAVVAADGDAAVVLQSVLQYSAGLLIGLEFRRRADGDHWQRFPEDTFLGVELADGTKVVADPSGRNDATAVAYSLVQRGGGGGGRRYELTYWLSPTPPAGDVVLVVHAVGLGLPEGRVVLPAAELAGALEQVRELWPWEPERPDAYRPPDRPVPPGGWFESTES
ncbi:hypothetical protein [Cellulomonas sp. URHE0023]|uniref:hypothetical protein n=1 Tax=Cellulomonas sp. URHE0023 TaxID=1380354 RepID=UPI000489805D|nr:hypothetical protein [Cellulomonas sp. URHE0023]